ncbi:MAG: antibiotic biosynthesis monooxygenase [Phenylobacterium sp.]|uniref:putative quinol monooxygenase n=1 Tax=Phenylobacterium sp. TaxID=1871053 RepID=UPI0025EA1B1F|nr:putative quinol monooxygenase [Phenylobacterium sp.]MCA3757281.1 antibiotic biosynthesis monooxygenase [Phenylobacterium sp.]
MTLIIAGSVRVPPENLERFRPHMKAMLEASRAEDGCLDYTYAEDVAEPGRIRVFEVWRDEAALEAHFQTSHMAEWCAHWPNFGVSDRRLFAYEIASQRPL